ncbi:MAG: tol-pal system-associated acyl-CoA thioesterase [Alphaproteobacteria bacterium]
MTSSHTIKARVYYENTDAGGVVYHSDYLKFAARGRTELLRHWGGTEQEWAEKEKVLFVVTHADIKFKSPARLDDLLTIATSIKTMTKFRMTFDQKIYVETRLCVAITIEIVCVDLGTYKPIKFPEYLQEKAKRYIHD